MNQDELEILRKETIDFSENSPLFFQVLVTTVCNAHCYYCYQHGIPAQKMDEKTANQVVLFIKGCQSVHPFSAPVNIEWFGGEPTVNSRMITYICDRLEKSGVRFTSAIYSNGILLDSALIISAMNHWNLKRAQITLDAANEKYEKIRGLSGGYFQKVLENIISLSYTPVRTTIRINYSGTEEPILNLIQVLQSNMHRFGRKPRFYIAPLYEDCREYSKKVMEDLDRLNDQLIASGLMKSDEIYNISRKRIRCVAATSNGYTIAPDGKLYNCSHAINDEHATGTVWSYNPGSKNRQEFLPKDFPETCKACKLLPVCMGGCRAAELRIAKMNQCIPFKNIFDIVLQKRFMNPGFSQDPSLGNT